MKTPVAYDYDAQRWITGESAEKLRQEQLRDELDLLMSMRGEEFARFIGVKRQVAIDAIKSLLTD